MSRQEVVSLMSSSASSQEWNTNADKVKQSYGGGYPDFWFAAIILSGVYNATSAKW